MTVLSEEAASRRLRAVDASQESIETTSLWIMHHKDSADTMLHSWMNVFRIGTEKQRLALFYVANDVCQKTRKRPGYDMLRSAFVPRLIGAMSLIRSDEAMKSKIIRVVDIWEQREVFEKPTIGELRSALSMTYEDSSDVDERLLLEFDPATLITDLEKFQKIEAAIEKARVILSKGNFDFQAQIKDRLKDRREGQKFLKEVDETCKKMGDFVTALEAQLSQHHRLIELLEQARGFFGQQLRDATVVEDAYQMFGKGIGSVKDELEEMIRTGAYLGASPPRDAPSPSADDDPFASGVEEAIRDMKKPGARDLIETSDMDVEDDSDAVTIHAGGMNFNLHANQSFMSGGAGMQEQMMNMMGHAGTKQVDPRIERMQLASKRRIEAVNAQLAAGGKVPRQAGGPNDWQNNSMPPPPMPPSLHALPTSPTAIGAPVGAGWMPPPPNFSIPPPGLVNFAVPPPGLLQTPSSSSSTSNSEADTPRAGANRRNLTVVSRS